MKRLRVGVVYGGRSGEHEVSIASAASVFAHLDPERYDAVALRIDRDGRWMLADRPPSAPSAADVIHQARTDASRLRGGREVLLPPRPGDDTLYVIGRPAADGDAPARLTGVGLDVVFPVLHGPYGEDGTVQGLFELAGLPYVGCGVLASAVGMDKIAMKRLFQAWKLPVAEWRPVARTEWQAGPKAVIAGLERALGFPMFVKPARLGSSVGISKAGDRAALAAALDLAAGFDDRIIVEAAVPGAREIECGVLGNDAPEASVAGEIIPAREFYDYEAKYLDDRTRLEIPAPLGARQARDVARHALAAFRAIDGAGLARVDFLLSRTTGRLYVSEINTLPGFTTISMFPKLWAASGVEYPALLDRLIALALDRHAARTGRARAEA